MLPIKLRLSRGVAITTGLDVSSYLHLLMSPFARTEIVIREEKPALTQRFLSSGYPVVGTSPPALTLVLTFIVDVSFRVRYDCD